MSLKHDLKKEIQTLQNIVSRKGSSKILTFSMPHVFKALQLMLNDGYVSRSTFCKQLHIGEGAAKTLVRHMKAQRIADTVRAGTYLTEKGKRFAKAITDVIADECVISRSSIFDSRYNHAILIKNHANLIRTGVEQRDFAILYGASVALTLIYQNEMFSFPDDRVDALADDKKALAKLMGMHPQDGDVVIITSATDPFVAEIAVKNSALRTIAT